MAGEDPTIILLWNTFQEIAKNPPLIATDVSLQSILTSRYYDVVSTMPRGHLKLKAIWNSLEHYYAFNYHLTPEQNQLLSAFIAGLKLAINSKPQKKVEMTLTELCEDDIPELHKEISEALETRKYNYYEDLLKYTHVLLEQVIEASRKPNIGSQQGGGGSPGLPPPSVVASHLQFWDAIGKLSDTVGHSLV